MATITHDDVGVVVNNCVTGLVKFCSEVSFCHCQTDAVSNSLSQGACGNFDAFGNEVFGVSRSFGFPLAKLFDVVEADAIVAGQVHEGVL